MKKTKVVCIGEALIDRIKNKSNLGSTDFVGGAPANVASALRKLKIDSIFIGSLGSDNFGKKIIEKLGAKYFAVTLGSEGALLLDKNRDMIHEIPILSTKVLDRIGAGDAFLSLAGLCLGRGLDSEVALFVGSAAAALDVQVVCNREPITPVNLYKYINTLLKS